MSGNFIEITQDAAAVIEHNQENHAGFFTKDIQSCVVTVYECQSATVMVHDSGQLKIADIVSLIEPYGSVSKIFAAIGPDVNSELHQPRFDKILSSIGYAGDIEVNQCPESPFAYLYPLGGVPKTCDNSRRDDVIRMPDQDVRVCVNELNNFFLESNSQSLGLDVQYIDGEYTSRRGLDYSVEEMLDIVKSQPEHFFANLAFLEKGSDLGVVELSSGVLDLASEENVGQFKYRMLNEMDLKRQRAAFDKYNRL